MDRELEDLQFLGLIGIYRESYKIIHTFSRIFTKITLALILPLCFIFLAQIEASEFLLRKISRSQRQEVGNANANAKLYHRLLSEWAVLGAVKLAYFTFFAVFSLLSTAAVVYTVASIYTGRRADDLTFRKVMSVVPEVWKRLMLTFVCGFDAIFLVYNVVTVVTITTWSFTIEAVHVVGLGTAVLIVIAILDAVGFVYTAVIWQLASVVSVLEDLRRRKAMTKCIDLIRGKTWIAVLIFIELNLAMIGIQMLFQRFVVRSGSRFGVAGRLGLGFLCLLLLLMVFLFGLVVQTVIYFVCKSYHHESLDKSSLSDHLAAYLGEYVPLQGNELVQLQPFHV